MRVWEPVLLFRTLSPTPQTLNFKWAGVGQNGKPSVLDSVLSIRQRSGTESDQILAKGHVLFHKWGDLSQSCGCSKGTPCRIGKEGLGRMSFAGFKV